MSSPLRPKAWSGARCRFRPCCRSTSANSYRRPIITELPAIVSYLTIGARGNLLYGPSESRWTYQPKPLRDVVQAFLPVLVLYSPHHHFLPHSTCVWFFVGPTPPSAPDPPGPAPRFFSGQLLHRLKLKLHHLR